MNTSGAIDGYSLNITTNIRGNNLGAYSTVSFPAYLNAEGSYSAGAYMTCDNAGEYDMNFIASRPSNYDGGFRWYNVTQDTANSEVQLMALNSSGNLTTSGIIHISTNQQVLDGSFAYGAFINWNGTGGQAETDFINSCASEYPGGFNWYNVTTGAANTEVGLMSLNGSGDLSTSGYIATYGHCGVTNLSLPQGGYINWNTTCGDGKMDFICSKGLGPGGFLWFNVTSDQANQNPPALMELDYLGNLYATNYIYWSDYRIKENVISLDDDKDKDKFTVDKLRPVHYTHKKTQKESIGLIAHEVQEVFPFLVTGEKDAEKLQGVDYAGLIPVLIKEIQDLKKELSEIKKQIND